MDTLAATPPCRRIQPTREVPTLVEDVVAGLFHQPKSLPAKYFYDDRGSELFDQICDEPEYYPTRTEDALLATHAVDIIRRVQPEQILELGSGMSRKTRHLLSACEQLECHASYLPFDVCDDVLIKSGRGLMERYGWLEVQPLVGDYTAGLGNVPLDEGTSLVTFLGGTIGNFAEDEAVEFLREVRGLMRQQDRLLMGADRVKAPTVLHAAYNDEAGITAAFNQNLLSVLNRELDADFDASAFQHYACFNPVASRIEMYLVSEVAQSVRFGALDRSLEIPEGEAILTEISRKFTRPRLEHLLERAGFAVDVHYEADPLRFSLVLARPA